MTPKMTPTASVIIPSYNHAAFIEEAVRSVLHAGETSPGEVLEVVVVDDGSTDDSMALLDALARQDPRLRVVGQKNLGAHAALQRGLEMARGELIFILNSDDVFHPERLRRFSERFAARPDLLMLGSWIEIINGAGQSLGIKRAWHNMPPWPRRRKRAGLADLGGAGLADLGDPALALVEANYLATTSNIAFRRRLFDEGARFLPLRYAHDWDFFLGALERGPFELIEEPLVRYRVHGANTIREEREEAQARGRMRFEILWVVARHAAVRLAGHSGAAEGLGHPAKIAPPPRDLADRLWNSLPDFTPETLFAQLLALRGQEREPPPAYDRLLEDDHPLRRAAIELLGERP